jgi:hypothetical protein
MKHLRKFIIFESSDNDDEDTEIYPGFEYSFADIKDTLYDILDLGFQIKESGHLYWSEDFNREKLTNAKWAVWEFTLEANVECKTLTKYYTQRYGGNSERKLLNNSNLELEVLQSVSDIRSRFGNVYHRLELKSDYSSDKGWILSITIMTEIDSEEISNAKTKEKESQIKDKIYDKINNLSKKIRNIGTPKFQSLSKKNKLGETSWSGLGKISEGYICIFINTNEMTKQVKKSIEQIENVISYFSRFLPEGSKIELRKFTKQDCQRLSKIHLSDQKYFEDRYLDLDGVFIEYNYEKWYNDLKNKD